MLASACLLQHASCIFLLSYALLGYTTNWKKCKKMQHVSSGFAYHRAWWPMEHTFLPIYPPKKKKIKLRMEKKSLERKYVTGLLETKTHRAGIKTFQSTQVYWQHNYVSRHCLKLNNGHRKLGKSTKKIKGQIFKFSRISSVLPA